jgi:DNA-binding transcriptional MerR regulator
MATLLPIGQLAKATGVSISTIRYYDEIGIVNPAGRVGGKRRLAPEAIGRISFVRRAQEAGFTLSDIKTILDDQARLWPALVRTHLESLRTKRAQLDVMISMLEEVERCGCEIVAECPRVPIR